MIDSADVNALPAARSAGDNFTAKDFRTWAGTVMAAKELAETAGFTSQTEAKRNVGHAIERVARAPGQHEDRSAASATCTRPFSTPTWTASRFNRRRRVRVAGGHQYSLSPEELAVVDILERHLNRAKTAA